jgi:hypothetical protein
MDTKFCKKDISFLWHFFENFLAGKIIAVVHKGIKEEGTICGLVRFSGRLLIVLL